MKNTIFQMGICLSVAHCGFLSGSPKDCRLTKSIRCNVSNNENTQSLRFVARYLSLVVPRGGRGKDCKEHLPFPAKKESEMDDVRCYLYFKSAQGKFEESGQGGGGDSLAEDGSIMYDCDAHPPPPRDDFVATVKWQKLTETAIANLDGVELEMTCSNDEGAYAED